MSRTYKSEGIVLKRRNAGEADRVVTIFTKNHGKVVAVAKGVRKISSRRAGSLEPATQSILFFAKAKTFDIITQTQLINSFSDARKSLKRLTQVHQILEVVDLLTRENQAHPQVYTILVQSLQDLNTNGSKRHLIVDSIRRIIVDLGFGQPEDDSEEALKHHLESITDRELRSKKNAICSIASAKILYLNMVEHFHLDQPDNRIPRQYDIVLVDTSDGPVVATVVEATPHDGPEIIYTFTVKVDGKRKPLFVSEDQVDLAFRLSELDVGNST